MSIRTQHVWEFIETMFGPIVFVGYFGLTYLLSALGCTLAGDQTIAREENEAIMGVSFVALTLIALVALAFIGAAAARHVASPEPQADEEDAFLAYITLCLAGFSAVAVLWTAATAAVTPLCA
jgi:hypothetical protein